MEQQRIDLGPVADLHAQAFGEPGGRTFRLLVQTAEGEVSFWLEKEQVVMLGSAIRSLQEKAGKVSPPATARSEPTFMGELEVRVGSLAVGFTQQGEFVIEASDLAAPFEIASISFSAAQNQVARMLDQIDEIVAASRPRCPLCATPLTGGPHFCPESNGHTPLSTSD